MGSSHSSNDHKSTYCDVLEQIVLSVSPNKAIEIGKESVNIIPSSHSVAYVYNSIYKDTLYLRGAVIRLINYAVVREITIGEKIILSSYNDDGKKLGEEIFNDVKKLCASFYNVAPGIYLLQITYLFPPLAGSWNISFLGKELYNLSNTILSKDERGLYASLNMKVNIEDSSIEPWNGTVF